MELKVTGLRSTMTDEED